MAGHRFSVTTTTESLDYRPQHLPASPDQTNSGSGLLGGQANHTSLVAPPQLNSSSTTLNTCLPAQFRMLGTRAVPPPPNTSSITRSTCSPAHIRSLGTSAEPPPSPPTSTQHVRSGGKRSGCPDAALAAAGDTVTCLPITRAHVPAGGPGTCLNSALWWSQWSSRCCTSCWRLFFTSSPARGRCLMAAYVSWPKSSELWYLQHGFCSALRRVWTHGHALVACCRPLVRVKDSK